MNAFTNTLRHVFARIAAYENCYLHVWPMTSILPEKRIIRPRSGMKMEVRSIFGEDFVVVHEMFSRDDYQMQSLRPQHTPPVIVDAGANVGAFSVLVASLFKNAR